MEDDVVFVPEWEEAAVGRHGEENLRRDDEVEMTKSGSVVTEGLAWVLARK